MTSLTDEVDLEKYFIGEGLDILIGESKTRDLAVNEMQVEGIYKPELKDLYRLHRFIIEFKRTTVLEFGCGWSSLVMADALQKNHLKYSEEIKDLRRNNAFELHVLDNERTYLAVAEKRLVDRGLSNSFFHYSESRMESFNGRIATGFDKLPLINPDFIYLDGPDQFNIKGDICGINTGHKDMMPMSCDILKIEHYLTPGTMIVVDGRGANTRFLLSNLQRNWEYQYDIVYDQHILRLNEPALGEHNQRQLSFYKNGAAERKFNETVH